MSLLLATSFEHTCRATGTAERGTVTVGAISTNAPRTGSYHAYSQFFYYPEIADRQQTNHIAFGYYQTDTNARQILDISIPTTAGGTTYAQQLRINTLAGSGELQALFNSGESTITTSGFSFTSTTWYWFEVTFTVSDTVGVLVLKIDGVTYINASGLDTKSNSGYNETWGFARLGNNQNQQYFDDVIFISGDGSGLNSLPGVCRVQELLPNGNGNYSQLTGSDGNSTDNYLQVDEPQTPSTADYNGSATVADKDTYTMEDISTSLTVKGVQAWAYALKSDASAKQGRIMARRASTDASGSDKNLSTDAQFFSEEWDVDPTDSSSWTAANVNSLEVGWEVRT